MGCIHVRLLQKCPAKTKKKKKKRIFDIGSLAMESDYHCSFVPVIATLCSHFIIETARLPMGVFGAGYDVNTFSFIKCSFYPGFLSLKKKKKRKGEHNLQVFLSRKQNL